MTNDEYLVFERVFRPAATRLLETIRAQLIARGEGPFSDIEVTDHDIDRGLEFRLSSDGGVFVELRLVDGDTYDYEGVGLVLDCSVFASGVVWAPGNYTESVGMTDPAEVVLRIESCRVDDVVEAIASEWAAKKNEATERMKP